MRAARRERSALVVHAATRTAKFLDGERSRLARGSKRVGLRCGLGCQQFPALRIAQGAGRAVASTLTRRPSAQGNDLNRS